MISKNKNRITISLTKDLIINIDSIVNVNQNKTRSDVIQDILSDYFTRGDRNEKKRN